MGKIAKCKGIENKNAWAVIWLLCTLSQTLLHLYSVVILPRPRLASRHFARLKPKTSPVYMCIDTRVAQSAYQIRF